MAKTAELYRMVMPEHVCPYGLKSKYLLEREGFEVRDHHLRTREETDAFQRAHGVKTTPQTFVASERIGGYDDLRRLFGDPPRPKDAPTYRPVIVVFAVSALIAVALASGLGDGASVAIRRFVALAMCFLAVQKLRDVESFSTMFLNYDLLARRFVPYAYAYPYLEAAAGVLMAGGIWPALSGPVALVIGAVGAISVFKAVYVEKRELKCACVGGDSTTPLGFVSMTESLMMAAMGFWTLARLLASP
jgi:glutaredoxin